MYVFFTYKPPITRINMFYEILTMNIKFISAKKYVI